MVIWLTLPYESKVTFVPMVVIYALRFPFLPDALSQTGMTFDEMKCPIAPLAVGNTFDSTTLMALGTCVSFKYSYGTPADKKKERNYKKILKQRKSKGKGQGSVKNV